MDLVIDIHGYYGLRNQPFIKELAILSIQTNNSDVCPSIDKHYVFAPPYRWELLSKNSQNQYSKMFNTHGIPWQLGFYNPDLQSSILRDNIINARRIYLFDMNIKKFLSKITSRIKNKQILSLSQVVSYVKVKNLYTQCNHHQYPKYNNCAYDNAMKMRKLIVEKLWKERASILNISKKRRNKKNIVSDWNRI